MEYPTLTGAQLREIGKREIPMGLFNGDPMSTHTLVAALDGSPADLDDSETWLGYGDDQDEPAAIPWSEASEATCRILWAGGIQSQSPPAYRQLFRTTTLETDPDIR